MIWFALIVSLLAASSILHNLLIHEEDYPKEWIDDNEDINDSCEIDDDDELQKDAAPNDERGQRIHAYLLEMHR